MPRNMSFAMTTEQIKNKTKIVTRRYGWIFLKPGDLVQPVEKAMGLKPGEKMKKIGGLIRIVSTYQEPLSFITHSDVVLEGFPDWTADQFIQMLVDHYKVDPMKEVNRIQFEYLD